MYTKPTHSSPAQGGRGATRTAEFSCYLLPPCITFPNRQCHLLPLIYILCIRSIYIGWVDVSWQRHCTKCRSLRELETRVHTVFFFGFLLAVTATGGRVRLFVPGGDPLLRTRGMIGSCSVYGEAPMRQLHDNLIAVSGSGHTGKQNQSIRRCHPYARKSASRAVLSVMQLTIQATRRTPHGASRLVLAMSAWSVKTRRAPSRHCRDANVYGHMTTAMPVSYTHLTLPTKA